MLKDPLPYFPSAVSKPDSFSSRSPLARCSSGQVELGSIRISVLPGESDKEKGNGAVVLYKEGL